ERKNSGKASSINVYFRLLDSGRNFNTGDEQYSPGSLMKVMTLITYLKDAERNPALFEKQITYNTKYTDSPSQLIIAAKGAELGKTYTIEQLLELMIVYSDNNATSLLNERIDFKVYNEVLSALELPVPDPHQADYPLTAEQMSKFFRLLYNSSFLSPQMSDRALDLLSRCAYDAGFNRYLKGQLEISHKFGERNVGNDFQVHEGGIFYLGQSDYVLIVMTRGNDQAALQEIIADISRLIYQEMITNYGVVPTNDPALTKLQSVTPTAKG
ncbi:MAG: serine hydrolase, partial [Bacteroidota bacterium]